MTDILNPHATKTSAYEIIRQFKIEQHKMEQMNANSQLPPVVIPKRQREKTAEDMRKEEDIIQLQLQLTALKNPPGGRPFPVDFSKPNHLYETALESLKNDLEKENEKIAVLQDEVNTQQKGRIVQLLEDDQRELSKLKQ